MLSMRITVTASAIALSVLSATAARADERADIASATSAVAAARAALGAWAKEQPEALPLARRIRESEPLLAVAPFDLSISGQVLAEGELARIAGELAPIREELARRSEELVLGTAAPPHEAPPVTTETIDARALVEAAPDFPQSWPGLPDRVFERSHGMAGGTLTFGNDKPSPSLGVDADKLVDLLGASGARVTLNAGILTLEGTAPDVRAAHETFTSLRDRLTPVRVALDLRAYSLTRSEWSALGRDGLLLDAGGERRLEEAAAAGRAKLLGREVLATIDGQLSGVDLGVTRVTILPADTGPVSTLTPVWYRTGLAVETRTRLSADRRSVLVTAALRFADHRTSSRTRIGGTQVSLPELGFARARSETRIPLGRTSVLAGTFAAAGAETEDATGCIVFATPRLAPTSPTALASSGPPPVAPAAAPLTLTTLAREIARIEAILRSVDEAIALARETAGLHLEIFDVRDLLACPEEYPGPRLGVGRAENLDAGGSSETRAAGLEPEQLEQIVKTDIGVSAYELHRGEILLQCTRTAADQVRAALERVRARLDRRVACEASLYRLDAGLARELERLSPDAPAQLSSQALAALDRASVETPGRARLLAGGLVSGFEDQRIYVTCGRERLVPAGLTDERADAVYLGARTGFVLDVRVREDEHGVRAQGRLSFARAEPAEKIEASGSSLEASALLSTMEPFDGVVVPGGAILLTLQLEGEANPLAVVIRPSLGPR